MKLHLLSFIELVPTQDRTMLDECDLQDFIQLVMNVLSLVVLSWLEALKKFDHVFCVFLVNPLENAALSLIPGELKEFLESLHEGSEEEASVDFDLDMFGKLIDISHVFLRLEPGHLVIRPVELEEVLHLLLKVLVHQSAIVVLGQHPHEPGESIGIFIVLAQYLKLIYDLHKYTHDQGENHDSEQQDEGDNKSFNVALWVEVSETNGT